jgi:hypothetical protein
MFTGYAIMPNNKTKKVAKKGARNEFGFRPKGLSTNPERSDTSLSLTRAQFTATTPQTLWEIRPASTPGGMRVRGRELIGSVTAPSAIAGAFTLLDVGSSGANPPVSPLIFPRLISIASVFEHYIFHKANFLFISNQPTTATGEVLMAIDYDPEDNNPTSSTALMSNISATMANIYSNCSLQCLKSLARLPRFIVNQENNADKAQEYQAQFFVAVEGVTAATGAGLGYIVIEYDVEFFTPSSANS